MGRGIKSYYSKIISVFRIKSTNSLKKKKKISKTEEPDDLLTIEREIGEGKEINKDWIKGGFTTSLQEFWHRGRTFVKNKNLS